jgi:hypothetical protein
MPYGRDEGWCLLEKQLAVALSFAVALDLCAWMSDVYWQNQLQPRGQQSNRGP